MNNLEEITQLNEMLKRVEKLVSNMPETEQMIYQTMIKAKPDSLEHLKTIETIARNNIADAVTDHDYDDYPPDTFRTLEDTASTASPVEKSLSRKEEVERIYSSLNESEFTTVINSIKEEVAIREKYNYGNFLHSETKEPELLKLNNNFQREYLDDRNIRRGQTHTECYGILNTMGIQPGDKARDIIWYLYKREEDNFRSLNEESKAKAVSAAPAVENLEKIIEEYQAVKINRSKVNSESLMGLSDLKNLSKKLNGKNKNIQEIPATVNMSQYDELEEKYNNINCNTSGFNNKVGFSQMIPKDKAQAMFSYDLSYFKDHPSSNKRYYIFKDGSMAKETLDSFHFKTTDIKRNIDVVIEVAKEKGWKKIEIEGGKAYVESVYLAARREGIHVKPQDDAQKYLFALLDKKYKLNEIPSKEDEANSVSVKNAEEEFVVSNASEKKAKP